MKWAGETQILALSGNNILIFISLCQHIWDTFIRTQETKPDKEKVNPISHGIREDAQAIGILSASIHWYNKITELPGGHERKRFVDILGKLLRRSLLDDQAMSYPGHNGFSLIKDDWMSNSEIKDFLQHAVDYGVLIAVPHTTKESNRKPRTKWYLNPIYSPYFNIPENHVKEPLYVSVATILNWLKMADQDAMSLFNGKDIKISDAVATEKSRDSESQLDFFERFEKKD